MVKEKVGAGTWGKTARAEVDLTEQQLAKVTAKRALAKLAATRARVRSNEASHAYDRRVPRARGGK